MSGVVKTIRDGRVVELTESGAAIALGTSAKIPAAPAPRVMTIRDGAAVEKPPAVETPAEKRARVKAEKEAAKKAERAAQPRETAAQKRARLKAEKAAAEAGSDQSGDGETDGEAGDGADGDAQTGNAGGDDAAESGDETGTDDSDTPPVKEKDFDLE